MKIFSVMDKQVGVYHRPFAGDNSIVACRGLANITMDQNHPYGQNPEYFDIYEVGEFDLESGKLIPAEMPVFVASAVTLQTAQIVQSAKRQEEIEKMTRKEKMTVIEGGKK